MPSFLDELRHITATAQEDTLLAQALLDPAIQARIEKERAKAQPIVEGLIAKAKLAASKKETSFKVMDLVHGYNSEGWVDICYDTSSKSKPTRANLGVKAKAVYDYCTQELKLPTHINYRYDGGDGRGDRYDLTISWERQPEQPRY
jgi:hypothetical protein